MTTLEHKPGQEYTEEEIDRGLLAVAVHRGNTRRAEASLAETDRPIPRSTLLKWATKSRVDRYMELQKRILPQLRAQMAQDQEELVFNYSRAEMLAVGRALEKLQGEEDISLKDLAGSAKNFSIGKGVAGEKSLLFRGDATQIVEHRDLNDLAKGLKRLGVVDSTATELPAPDPSE